MYDNIIAMKLDIEGFETNVLLDLGEKDFLKRVKPCYIIWFEYTIAVKLVARQMTFLNCWKSWGTKCTTLQHSSEGAFLEARLCPYVYH